jgi:hypothetical protein
MAAWVIATIVHADDTAVPSTSADDMVGVPCGPQAVIKTASVSRAGKNLFNIFFSIFHT